MGVRAADSEDFCGEIDMLRHIPHTRQAAVPIASAIRITGSVPLTIY